MIGTEREALLHAVFGVHVAANDPEEDEGNKDAKDDPSNNISRL